MHPSGHHSYSVLELHRQQNQNTAERTLNLDPNPISLAISKFVLTTMKNKLQGVSECLCVMVQLLVGRVGGRVDKVSTMCYSLNKN